MCWNFAVSLYHLHLKMYTNNSLWKKSIRPSSSAPTMLYFSPGNFTKWKQSYYILKVFEGNLKLVCQNATKRTSHLLLTVYFYLLNEMYIQMFECFVITLLKWMSYKNRLLFLYYNISRFYCFKKGLQSVLKTWQVLK